MLESIKKEEVNDHVVNKHDIFNKSVARKKIVKIIIMHELPLCFVGYVNF